MEEKRRFKVLVVDDIQSNIEFVTDILELENFEVQSTKNGKNALSLANEFYPDLILLDISMPEMDGYEVCYALKENQKTKEIPVIFLTARAQKDDIIKGFEFGAVDFIVKPFNFAELTSRVKTHVDLKNKSEQLKNVNLELESIIEERTLQLKKAYTDLQVANQKLLAANDKLSKLDKAKTEFVLHINHELRTPLNGIQGYVDLLNESLKEEPYNTYVQSIQTLTERLISVAELSLLFTELKTRENQIQIQEVDLVETLHEAINCSKLSQKNIDIEVENPYKTLIVEAEPRLLQTCISIIIDNAIKYSPFDSTIEISVKRIENQIELALYDRGPGFSDKAMEQLFSFFSADNLSYKTHGFGIGLATAKIILNLFGGNISIANREPNGAIVKTYFKKKSD